MSAREPAGTKHTPAIPASITIPKTIVVTECRDLKTLSEIMPEKNDPTPPRIGDSDMILPAVTRSMPFASCRKITPQLLIE